MTNAQAETPSRVRLFRNRPAEAAVLPEQGTQDLPGRQMLGHQGEHDKAQLLHGMRAVDPGKGQRRSQWPHA